MAASLMRRCISIRACFSASEMFIRLSACSCCCRTRSDPGTPLVASSTTASRRFSEAAVISDTSPPSACPTRAMRRSSTSLRDLRYFTAAR